MVIIDSFSALALRADRFVLVNTQAPGEEPPTPEEAAALISVPEGFSVALFAGEARCSPANSDADR